ncbi:septation protein A [Comamonas serinivorans]|uniref:Inner membrane-spanning protein YciB n=1 Tax=Comamonas serinivorans TaxID=1082851 RepID=A0A1Y0EU42_9BURK|nr:septation protein A [Comamonas serinivorans]ARU06842.1 septation protein A [Comamonas serinivorans]
MKLLLDFFPILAFFVAYKLDDIYTGTAVLMACTVLQMGIVYAMERKLETMQKATLVLILVFGALTLGLHDDRFIKWKPTVLYVAIALVLAVGQWGFKKNLFKTMMGSQLPLPDRIWGHLSASFIVFSLFMAGLNAWVATYLSTEAYMNFKLWGFAIPVVYFVGFGYYAMRHMQDTNPTEPQA